MTKDFYDELFLPLNKVSSRTREWHNESR